MASIDERLLYPGNSHPGHESHKKAKGTHWDKSLPRDGWIFSGHTDRAHGSVCEMCGHTGVIYLFTLKHPDVAKTYNVGVNCGNAMVDLPSELTLKALKDNKIKLYDPDNWFLVEDKFPKRWAFYIQKNTNLYKQFQTNILLIGKRYKEY